MIEKFEELDFKDVDTVELVDQKIQEKLGVSILQMQQALSAHVLEKAEELTHEFVNIAPLGDYGKLLEDNDSMASFLKTEGHKPEHWQLYEASPSDVNPNLLSFHFHNDSVDDGDIFQGFVYVSLQGQIKHAFAQGE